MHCWGGAGSFSPEWLKVLEQAEGNQSGKKGILDPAPCCTSTVVAGLAEPFSGHC